MPNKFLLNHIKNLEKELEELRQKELKLKKVTFNMKKLCQAVLETTVTKPDVPTKILKYINFIGSNLGIEKKETLYQGNFLQKKVLFEFIKEFDLNENMFFIFRLRDSNQLDVAISFIESKFTPFLSLDINKIVGVLPKHLLKEFESVQNIPLFKDSVYKELKFFVVFFEINTFNEQTFHQALNIFDRFFLRPSFEDKTFIHYSLIENKIINFESRKKEQIKKEFAFLYELKYPEIELMARKEINNIKFILALLDRIDSELTEIRRSKGTIIVVKRILNFIHKNQIEKTIQEMVMLILNELSDK